MSVFRRLAVVGLGLLGGSVALGARRHGLVEHVCAATRNPEARQAALATGAVDEILPLHDLGHEADLVVLATPVHAMASMTREIAPSLRAGSIVTDVGSVKSPLAETLPGLLPPGAHYVGSHPMAGSHRSGFDFADPDLFEDAACVVLEAGAPEQEERVCAFWRGLGGRVLRLDARGHDTWAGWMSHLPHVLAFAFGRALSDAPEGAGQIAGPGFRDFTRIARSDPAMWADILSANRKALEGPIQRAARALTELSRTIESGDTPALEESLLRARQNLEPSPPAQGHGAESEARPSPQRGATQHGDLETTHD